MVRGRRKQNLTLAAELPGLIGERFGEAVLLRQTDMPFFSKLDTNLRWRYWGLFKCDCGNQFFSLIEVPYYAKDVSEFNCGHKRLNRLRYHTESEYKVYRAWTQSVSQFVYKHEPIIDGDRYEIYMRHYPNYEFMRQWLTDHNEKRMVLTSLDGEPISIDNMTYHKHTSDKQSQDLDLTVNGVTYNTINQLARAYNMQFNTVKRRYSKGARDMELVKGYQINND